MSIFGEKSNTPLNIFGETHSGAKLTQESIDAVVSQLNIEVPTADSHAVPRSWVLSEINNAVINGATVSGTAPLSVNSNVVSLATDASLQTHAGQLRVNPTQNLTEVVVSGTIDSTNTNSGSMRVSGGLSVAKNFHASGVVIKRDAGGWNGHLRCIPNVDGQETGIVLHRLVNGSVTNAGDAFIFAHNGLGVGAGNAVIGTSGAVGKCITFNGSTGAVTLDKPTTCLQPLTVPVGTANTHACTKQQMETHVATQVGTREVPLTFSNPLIRTGNTVTLSVLGDAHVSALNAAKLTGNIDPARIASASLHFNKIDAATIGNLTGDMITGLPFSKLTGSLAVTQIDNGTITWAKLSVPNDSVTGDMVISVPASKLTGTMSSDRIATGALHWEKLNASTVVVGDSQITGMGAAKVTGAFTQVLTVSNTTVSTSTSTGALTVAGGIGVAGSVFAANFHCRSTTTSAGIKLQGAGTFGGPLHWSFIDFLSGNGSLIHNMAMNMSTNELLISTITASPVRMCSGGGTLRIGSGAFVGGNRLEVEGNTHVSGVMTIANTTGSVSTTTGALVCNGGMAVGRDLRVQQSIFTNGDLGVVCSPADRPLITRGFDPFTSGIYNGAGRWGVFMEGGALTAGIPTLTGRSFKVSTYNENSTVANTWFSVRSEDGFTSVLSTVQSTSTSTGALTVSGGMAVAKNLYVGGTISGSFGVLTAQGSAVAGRIQHTVRNTAARTRFNECTLHLNPSTTATEGFFITSSVGEGGVSGDMETTTTFTTTTGQDSLGGKTLMQMKGNVVKTVNIEPFTPFIDGFSLPESLGTETRKWNDVWCRHARAEQITTGNIVSTDHLPVNVANMLGSASNRWWTVHLQNAPIVASDARLKRDITRIDEKTAQQLVKDVDPVTFQWKSETPLTSGTASGRQDTKTYCGFISQEVRKALKGTDLEHTNIVTGTDDTMLALSPIEMIPIMWKCIQSLLKKK